MNRFAAMLMTPLLLAASPVVQGDPVPVGAAAVTPALDAAARREVIAAFIKALREQYVFPDVANRVATAMEAALAAKRYDSLADPAAFAARLSADAAAIAHDKHLEVISLSAPPPPRRRMAAPRGEGGLARADRLAAGIGYVEVLGFPPPSVFKRALDRGMAGLAGSRALIIDVRRNGGGSPESVAYLVSYLVKPDRPINDIVSRTERTSNFTRQSYRGVPTPISFTDAPVFVLTSANTFSGGEEFAYDVQALRRGAVVGEVTGGGANPTGSVDLGHGIEASIPFGRAENPYTKTNWEGRGVQPDVRVAAADALRVALVKAGGKPVAEIGAASVQQVFAARATPLPGSEQALRRLLAAYAGGEPDDAALTPAVAADTRRELPALRAQFAPLGPLKSIRFLGPDMLGGDEYELHFEHGGRMMALVVGPDGKVAAVSSAIPLPTEE